MIVRNQDHRDHSSTGSSHTHMSITIIIILITRMAATESERTTSTSAAASTRQNGVKRREKKEEWQTAIFINPSPLPRENEKQAGEFVTPINNRSRQSYFPGSQNKARPWRVRAPPIAGPIERRCPGGRLRRPSRVRSKVSAFMGIGV